MEELIKRTTYVSQYDPRTESAILEMLTDRWACRKLHGENIQKIAAGYGYDLTGLFDDSEVTQALAFTIEVYDETLIQFWVTTDRIGSREPYYVKLGVDEVRSGKYRTNSYVIYRFLFDPVPPKIKTTENTLVSDGQRGLLSMGTKIARRSPRGNLELLTIPINASRTLISHTDMVLEMATKGHIKQISFIKPRIMRGEPYEVGWRTKHLDDRYYYFPDERKKA